PPLDRVEEPAVVDAARVDLVGVVVEAADAALLRVQPAPVVAVDAAEAQLLALVREGEDAAPSLRLLARIVARGRAGPGLARGERPAHSPAQDQTRDDHHQAQGARPKPKPASKHARHAAITSITHTSTTHTLAGRRSCPCTRQHPLSLSPSERASSPSCRRACCPSSPATWP